MDKPASDPIERGTPRGVPGGARALRPNETIDSPLTAAEQEKFSTLLGPAPTTAPKRAAAAKLLALAADDDPDFRAYVCRAAKDMGFELLEASTGAQALLAVAQKSPDLVVLDLAMPGMDGYEVLRGARNYLKLKDLYVIVVTGMKGLPDEASALSLGADAFLCKPVPLERLEGHLKAAARRLRSP